MRWMGWRGMVRVVGVLLLALLGLATRADAHLGDGIDGNAIHACVNKRGGVRIVGPNGSCKPNETPLHWSIVGPQGPQGPQGPAGPAGP